MIRFPGPGWPRRWDREPASAGQVVFLPGEEISIQQCCCEFWASLVARTVQIPPAVQENWVRSLSWKDPLEKRLVPPVFLPGDFLGQRSLVGYSPQGHKELDTTG